MEYNTTSIYSPQLSDDEYIEKLRKYYQNILNSTNYDYAAAKSKIDATASLYNSSLFNLDYNYTEFKHDYFDKIDFTPKTEHPHIIRIPIPVYGVILLLKIIFYIFCCRCIRNRNSRKKSTDQVELCAENQLSPDDAPVVVTSSTHVPPNAGVNYPNAGVNYPVDEPVRNYQSAHPPYSQSSYPMPQPAAVHTTAPYPTNNTGMPMPQSSAPYPPAQPMGYQAPYPPVQNPQDVLPPSYDQVVGTTGPTTTPYNKQSPYNPHFTGN